MNVTVFCGSSNKAPQDFLKLAYETGVVLAARKHGLVYGGGGRGLMGEVARGFKEFGGFPAHGVTIPRWHDPAVDYAHAQQVTVCHDIAERKRLLFEAGDAFVVLPGSFGTFDEVALIMAEAQYGTHNKPIICISEYFFSPLLALINRMTESGLADQSLETRILVIDSPKDLPF
jgi:uncharacterized protein (TIGR00730 family)